MNKNSEKYIRTAAMIALAGNAVLAALKLVFGMLSGSAALIGDGIDSSADVLISIVALAVVKIIAKPADKQHPWGHGRAETVAVAVLSFILFFAGAQLIFSSASNLISGVVPEPPSLSAMIVSLVSIAGKILLAYSQYTLGRRSGSAMIQANAKNMLGDVAISVGVLAGLGISNLTGSGLADMLIACAVGAWVIKTAVGIFLGANLELMDGSTDTQQYQMIFDAVNSVEGASNPHRTRIRRIGGFWDIDTDIEVDPNITVEQAHRIASQAETAIKERLEHVFDVMIHVEPQGSRTPEDGFGLSAEELDG